MGFDRLDFTHDTESHRTRIVETRRAAAGSPITTRDLRYQADAVVEESVNNVIVRSTIVDDAGDLLALWRSKPDGIPLGSTLRP